MVTPLYAGILGFIYIGLSFLVILGRWKHKVNMGDGGQDELFKRIRLHGNFIEYVPFALILIFLAEREGASEVMIHVLGMMLVVSRIIHPIGLYYKFGMSGGRTGGMVLTFFVILVASFLCLKSYFVF